MTTVLDGATSPLRREKQSVVRIEHSEIWKRRRLSEFRPHPEEPAQRASRRMDARHELASILRDGASRLLRMRARVRGVRRKWVSVGFFCARPIATFLGRLLGWPPLFRRELERMSGDTDLDERGEQLRAALEQTYSQLMSKNALRPRPYINDMTSFIKDHIDVGISFDDAEQILRAAGFVVCGRPSADTQSNRPDKYEVQATLLLESRWLSAVEFAMGMAPAGPGDYRTVKNVWGAIIITYT